MKNTILSIATMLAATAMTVSACTATAHTAVTSTDMSIPSDARITGSGNIITRRVSIADFSRIETSRAVHLVVEKRSGREAIIEADDNIMPYVIVEVDGGCLTVSIDNEIKSLNDVTVKVTVPSDGNISTISASSASKVTVQAEIKTPKLMLDASSAANINIANKSDVGTCSIEASSAANVEGAIKADNCVIDMSSASDVNVALLAVKCDVTASSASSATISGEAGDIDLSASSAAKIDAMDLNARNAEAEASSGGSIKVTCMKSIDASASSGGSVKYAAKGDLDSELKHTSSGGSVKKL